MPSISFEIWCSCGEELCYQTKSVSSGIIVEPCQLCLNKAFDEDRNEGYDKEYADAKEEIDD